MRFPSRKVPVFEPVRMAKGTRCPYALDSNTIPFHASASYAPIWTSEKSCATCAARDCAARDNGRSRATKIAGCSLRAPRRRTRCLYRRSPVPSWLIARVIARERLAVDLSASFICCDERALLPRSRYQRSEERRVGEGGGLRSWT